MNPQLLQFIQEMQRMMGAGQGLPQQAFEPPEQQAYQDAQAAQGMDQTVPEQPLQDSTQSFQPQDASQLDGLRKQVADMNNGYVPPVQDPTAQAPPADSSGFHMPQLPYGNIARGALSGYFSAIGAPKLGGWGGALSKGGLGAISSLDDAQKLRMQQQYYDALTQARNTQAAAAAKPIQYINPKTGDMRMLTPKQVAQLDPASSGYIPLERVSPEMSKLLGAHPGESDVKWKWRTEVPDPASGGNVQALIGIDSSGQPVVKKLNAPQVEGGDAGAITDTSAGSAPSTLPTKYTEKDKELMQAADTAKAFGKDLYESIEKQPKTDKGSWLSNWFKVRGYKLGLASPEEGRAHIISETGALRLQLSTMAMRAAGTRASSFLGKFEEHFPQQGDSDARIKQKLRTLFAPGGVVDILDSGVRNRGFGSNASLNEQLQQKGLLEDFIKPGQGATTPSSAGGIIPPVSGDPEAELRKQYLRK